MGSGISVSLCICLSHGSVVSSPMATSGLTMTDFSLCCCWCSTSTYTNIHTHNCAQLEMGVGDHWSVLYDMAGRLCRYYLWKPVFFHVFKPVFSQNCRHDLEFCIQPSYLVHLFFLFLLFVRNFTVNCHHRYNTIVHFFHLFNLCVSLEVVDCDWICASVPHPSQWPAYSVFTYQLRWVMACYRKECQAQSHWRSHTRSSSLPVQLLKQEVCVCMCLCVLQLLFRNPALIIKCEHAAFLIW